MRNLTTTEVKQIKESFENGGSYNVNMKIDYDFEGRAAAVFNENGEYLGERRFKLEMAGIIKKGDLFIQIKDSDNEEKPIMFSKRLS